MWEAILYATDPDLAREQAACIFFCLLHHHGGAAVGPYNQHVQSILRDVSVLRCDQSVQSILRDVSVQWCVLSGGNAVCHGSMPARWTRFPACDLVLAGPAVTHARVRA